MPFLQCYRPQIMHTKRRKTKERTFSVQLSAAKRYFPCRFGIFRNVRWRGQIYSEVEPVYCMFIAQFRLQWIICRI